jgi:hypothetical protein
MRAAVVTRFGAPDVIEVSEIPDPIPGPPSAVKAGRGARLRDRWNRQRDAFGR